MKSYKDFPKSYKDYPKDIIMNAPEGAMWVAIDEYVGAVGHHYYKYDMSTKSYSFFDYICEGRGARWVNSLELLQCNPRFIPLPNVIIPWEATADSECPVPCRTLVDASVVSPSGDECGTRRDLLAGELGWSRNGCIDGWTIVSYKIIDPEYAKDNTQSEEKEASVEQLAFSRDSLVQKLKFLQNLGKEFPELQEETLVMMKKELYGYWEEMVWQARQC